MDSVELTHGNGAGTAVRMARSLSPDRVPAEACALRRPETAAVKGVCSVKFRLYPD